MFTLDALTEMSEEQLLACLLPMERAVHYLPCLVVNPAAVKMLRDGKSVQDYSADGWVGCVRLHDEEAHFIGLGAIQPDGVLVTKRLLAFDSSSE